MTRRRNHKPDPIIDSDNELANEDLFDDDEEIIEEGDLIFWAENDEVFVKAADAADVAKWGINGTEWDKKP